MWIKAADLREKVREMLGYNVDQMRHAQWIGHILNRLQLTVRNRRKAYTGGQLYLIECNQALDMMQRYEVEVTINLTIEKLSRLAKLVILTILTLLVMVRWAVVVSVFIHEQK
jgi:hypothetical protein